MQVKSLLRMAILQAQAMQGERLLAVAIHSSTRMHYHATQRDGRHSCFTYKQTRAISETARAFAMQGRHVKNLCGVTGS